jgi:hypothetical protein
LPGGAGCSESRESLEREITVRGWSLTSYCGLSFISGVRRNRTEFDYCGLFGSASAVVKPNPLSNSSYKAYNRDFDIWAGEVTGDSKLLQIVQFNSIQFNSIP